MDRNWKKYGKYDKMQRMNGGAFVQNGRLFHLIHLLLTGEKWTVMRLAQTMEVSERTIRRDIDALSAAGIPIYTTQGRAGGVHLMPEFVLDRALLSEQQQDEILCGLQTLHAAGVPEGKALLEELMGLFGRKSVNRWIDTDFSAWGEREENRSLFSMIQNAILEHQVLWIRYHAAENGFSEREIEPVRLCFRGMAWYMQAFCRERQAFRTFKLSRIAAIQRCEEQFIPHDILPSLSGSVESSLPVVHTVIRFSPKAAYRVLDEFPREHIIKQDDGGLLVHTDWSEGSWCGQYILSYGSLAEVLEPETLRIWIRQELRNLIKQYENRET